MLKFLLSLGVVYFVIESLKQFVVKAMEKENINNKLIQMDKLFAENEMQIQKKLDFSTQKIAAITKQANKLEVDANQFVQACGERSEQLVKLTLQSTVADMQNYMERMNLMLDSLGRKVLGDDNSVQYNDIIASQTKLELARIADEITAGITFNINTDSITNHRNFVSEMLDILEQINMDYSDITDSPQKGISSPQSKRITIEIIKKFVNARKTPRMTTVQLVNILPSLKERLKTPKNREYLIERLSSDKLFYQLFENTDY